VFEGRTSEVMWLFRDKSAFTFLYNEQICGSIATGGNQAVHMTMHRGYSCNFPFQLLRQRIVSAYHFIPCCSSHMQENMFSQIVLLQYKAKPYLLGFQNLGCHCKILGCHFDTQKRLKNHCFSPFYPSAMSVML